MTSSQGMELAALILEDPTRAIPLLRLLNGFNVARGDPLGEEVIGDVMLFVYSKVEHCRQSMNDYLADEPKPVAEAA